MKSIESTKSMENKFQLIESKIKSIESKLNINWNQLVQFYSVPGP